MAKKKSRMFGFVTDTWNPVTGCKHNCTYCWARELALEDLSKKLNVKHYQEHGFNPAVNENQFKRRFKSDTIVFVCDMGELFGEWVPKEWIERVIKYTHKFPETIFLYLTKNPRRYNEFTDLFTPNSILGGTLETNRERLCKSVSRAPSPCNRYDAMQKLDWSKKFISIEPIMDFDFRVFLKWLKNINPKMCAVGYDNYDNKLPEPRLSKTQKFADRVQEFSRVHYKSMRRAWWRKKPQNKKSDLNSFVPILFTDRYLKQESSAG